MRLALASYDPLPASAARSIAVVLVGDGDLDVSLDSLEERGDAEWCAAAMPPRNNQVSFDPQLVLQFLNGEAAACDIVLFAIAGTRFSGTALPRILSAFSKFPETAAVYGDLEIRNEDGRRWPIAFPVFDYERLLEQGYCAYVPAFRRSAVEPLLGAGCSDLYRLFNALFDATGTAGASIVHTPGALACLPPIDAPSAARALATAGSAHLQARGVAAEVTVSEGGAFPAVHVKRAIAPASVSIIIPTRNRSELLQTCIESIRPAATALGTEIIVIDNDSTEPEALAYLAKIDGSVARVIRVEGPFNFARLNNLAVEAARGEHLCLLNDDVEALDSEWLAEMMSRIAQPDVGAVGVMLIWPSGVVQHGGVVLGPSFAAAHAFNDRTDDDPGYADLLCVAHQSSAVTAACLMVRRTDYLAVGGMDAVRFPVNFNDVDLCLKLAALGKRIIFTPHARLLHVELASRGNDDVPERAARFRREITNLRNRWGEVLIDDPYYSPMLSLDPVPFSALAWPPRSMAPRSLGSAEDGRRSAGNMKVRKRGLRAHRSAILLVGDVLEPGHMIAVERLLHGDVNHGARGRRTMPVLLARRNPDIVARADFADWAAPGLHAAKAGDDVQRLSERMGVPGGARAGFERDPRGPDARRRRRFDDRVLPHRTGE